MKTKALLACFLAMATTILIAQAAPRPYFAEFTPPPEHAAVENGVPVVSNYELSIYPPGAATPLAQVVNLGKPTPVNGKISVDVTATMTALPASVSCNPVGATLNAAPPFHATCYVGTVTAKGPGGFAVSLPSPPFTLVPRAPTAPTGFAIK